MSELVVIVEGQTERAFVQKHLAAHLDRLNVVVRPILPGRRPNQGGVPDWELAKKDILLTLQRGAYCTTMFDYYGLPVSWPGRARSARFAYKEKPVHVEAELARAICADADDGVDCSRFIPYIQLHEYEALAFADVGALASVTAPVSNLHGTVLVRRYSEVLKEAGDDPEAINDGYETCPSRRILSIAPRYKKVLHGSIVIERIGMARLCERCRHFADWMERLESTFSRTDAKRHRAAL